MLQFPTRDDFAKQLNTVFQIQLAPDQPVDATLVEVLDQKKGPTVESFSILFLAPPDAPVDQRIFNVEHPELGSLELFLVPVGLTDEGLKYEGVFSRLIEPPQGGAEVPGP
jgi:hypothetical protein